MRKALRIAVAAIALIIAAFVVMVAAGVFTALDTASGSTLPASNKPETSIETSATTTPRSSEDTKSKTSSTVHTDSKTAKKSSPSVASPAAVSSAANRANSTVGASSAGSKNQPQQTSTANNNPAPSTSASDSGPDKVWIPATTTVIRHDAVYKIVTHPAEYDTIEVIRCSCGLEFSTNEAWSAHNKSLGFGNSHSYSVVDKPVLIKAAWNEPVLVSDVWYEPITIPGHFA